MKKWLKNLVEEARFLIGDSAEDNPEYARAMLELIASTLPYEADHARIVAGALLDLNPDEL